MKKKAKLQTTSLGDADIALLRMTVAGDPVAVAALERELTRIAELERYVDGMGDPLGIYVG